MRRVSQAILCFAAVTGAAQSRSVPLRVALLGSNSPVGSVTFRETMTGGLNVDIEVHALTPGVHAVHIHENPACDAPDLRTAGKHFNPDRKQHGWRNPAGHHAGDFPQNLEVDQDGDGHLNVTLYDLDMRPGSAHSVLGRSIVIHERGDDMKSDPSGNSGNRIACGVIPTY